MSSRPAAAALALAALASFGCAEKGNDPGPAPVADHQDLVRSAMGQVLARRPPPQPEHHQMAFFGGGKLRAIFSEGGGNAPLGLDPWSADWVDESWHPLPDHRTQAASSR